MNATSSNHPSSARELTHDALVDLLGALEEARRSVAVQIETEYGKGCLWTRGGKIVDARYGSLKGRPALFKLLNLSRGTFSLASDVTHPIAFSDAPSEVLAALDRRADEWRRLVTTGPSLDSMPHFDPTRLPLGAVKPEGDELRLLRLFDGSRMLVDAIDESGLDAVSALGVVHGFFESGLLTLDQDTPPPSTINQFPHAELEESGVVSGEARRRATEPPPAPDSGASSDDHKGGPVHQTALAVYRTVAVSGSVPRDDEPPRVKTLIGTARRTGGAPLVPLGSKTISEPPPPYGEPANLGADSQRPSGREVGGVGDDTSSKDSVKPVESHGATRLGRYEVLCCIKRGGMGSVYLARVQGEAGFRRLFALKVISTHLSGKLDANELFFHEARLSGRLHHPNVVNIVDLASEGDQPYLVMDYVEGCSFDELLGRHGTHRPSRLVTPIVLDVLSGLHAAHKLTDDRGTPLDLVHCDVTPHNMLVGADGACRLTDFGVARSRERAHDDQTRGKPGYLSPEQVSGGPIDLRSDIYSAGVVLYNALTGINLFRGRTSEETLQNVLHQHVLPPSQVGLKPPAAFDEVCMTALARRPEDRFESAEEMLVELRRVAVGESLLAPSSEVAAWVYSTFGQELQMRRLAALDGVRSARGNVPAALETGDAPPVKSEQRAPAKLSALRSRRVADDDAESRTILLQKTRSYRNPVLYVALGLVALAVVAALLFPDVLAKGFSIRQVDSEPATDSEPLKLDLETSTTGAVPNTGSDSSPSAPAMPR